MPLGATKVVGQWVNRTVQKVHTTVDSQLSGLYGKKQLYKKILPLNNYMR